jgi:lipopolysaccharide transport system ATP-binding protein
MVSIKFENISKQYRLGLVSTKTLSHDLNRWWTTNIRGKEDPYLKIGEVNDRAHKGESDYVWALKDIDFEVQQGDVLGIIGKNGAGKSTLLKILSKVTAPTTGTIRAAGRIASLLEVGTGFHPEMTGRENIYMNGAIMGMTKQEITRKLDEIVDFSGVERYLDTPAKRYSSGMTVRLGFAIAAHLDPEILVVDEVLAVGDAEFQKKAIGKMQDVSKGEGRTVLFVSHNMAAVRSLCNRGIVMENGSVVYQSNTSEEAISHYLYNTGNSDGALIANSVKIMSTKIIFIDITVNNSKESKIPIHTDNNKVKIHFEGEIVEKLRMATEIRIMNEDEIILATYSPGQMFGVVNTFEKGKFTMDEEFLLPTNLTKGIYYMSIALTNPGYEVYAKAFKAVELDVQGVISETGFQFNSKNTGFLILS